MPNLALTGRGSIVHRTLQAGLIRKYVVYKHIRWPLMRGVGSSMSREHREWEYTMHAIVG